VAADFPSQEEAMSSAVASAIRSVVDKGVTTLAAFNRRRIRGPLGPHPFLTGLHAPMSEELTLEELTVTGTIPPSLDGRYLRIGPNPIAADPRTYEWFLGDGMVHGVRLEGGRARWYRNRWVRSTPVTNALGEPGTPGPRHSDIDTVNTNILGLAGRNWALIEAGGTPALLDDELRTVAYDDFGGTLRGAFTAHPHLDPRTGEWHAVTYDPRVPTAVHHVVVAPDGRVRREEPVQVHDGPMIHDCGITGRFVLILDLPVTFSIGALIAGQSFPFRWNRGHSARIGLLPRDGAGSEVIWCDVDPCYVFHLVNAYDDEDGAVVADVVTYGSIFARAGFEADPPRGALERWTIDPKSRAVRRAVLDPQPQDFPRIDERRTGQTCRYAYTMALPETPDPALIGGNSLFKQDLRDGGKAVHDFGPHRYPGEFVFVPAHPAAAEDEGWLIGFVIDTADETTDLAILDVRDFGGPPCATVRIPHRVPPGFHGNWIPS
jgi:carotenoid cleavage dioxygenase